MVSDSHFRSHSQVEWYFTRWKYAVENNVQLPDEYDQIYNDLESFWGIEPSDLIQIQKEGELKQDTYTIGKNDEGEVEVLIHMFRDGTYDQFIAGSRAILDLFKPIQEYLPPFRMTLWPDDRPNLLTDYGVDTAAREAADSRTCEHSLSFICLPEEFTTQLQISHGLCCPESPRQDGNLHVLPILLLAVGPSISTNHFQGQRRKPSYGTTRLRWIHVTTQATFSTTASSSRTAWDRPHNLSFLLNLPTVRQRYITIFASPFLMIGWRMFSPVRPIRSGRRRWTNAYYGEAATQECITVGHRDGGTRTEFSSWNTQTSYMGH